MKRSFCFVPLLSALVLVLLLAGCWNPFKPPISDNPGPGPTDEILPRTTPQNVLNNLRVYYSVKDNYLTSPEEAHSLARQYLEMLHPDFKFYFLAGWVPPDLPENWWARDEESRSLDSLLTKRAQGIVNEIQLSWNLGPAQPDNRWTEPPNSVLLHPGWMHISANLVLLDVVVGEEIHRVNNGLADFYFAPDPADTTLWVISEWEDRPSL